LRARAFHFRADHSRITFPQSFLDASDGSDKQALEKIKRISNQLARKGEITHAGNKLPRYYFALHRINREVPAVYEVAAPLRDYLRRIASVLPHAIDTAFAACENRPVIPYGRTYVRQNRDELGALLKLVDGSKALADFQRFGPYQRLKSLYVQRWAVKRRFRTLRLLSNS
jgi:hypothetical protein